MKKAVLTFALALALVLTDVSFAKGPTLKVIISGGDLPSPIEITDRGRLANFRIWEGPGNTIGFGPGAIPAWKDEGFVCVWPSAGVVPPASLKKYQVSFYSNHHQDGLDYVITYAYDPVNRKGYVYLPGRGEAEYARNTFSILRGVEGNWFLARKIWDDLAGPLIQGETKSSK
jgi:hypothetical protein